MLPVSKNDAPRLLYLDQNKWIELARARYGKEDAAGVVAALGAVDDAVAVGKVIVPISGVHVMETMAPSDRGRRERLAEFMVGLSGNASILPYMALRPLEILHAVLRKLGRTPTAPLRPHVLGRGLTYALGAELSVSGIPAPAAEVLTEVLESRASSIAMLVEAADPALTAVSRREDEAAVAELEVIRARAQAGLTPQQRLDLEMATVFSTGPAGTELLDVLRKLGIGMQEFAAMFDGRDDWVSFFHDVPTMDVFVTLGTERDRSKERRIHRNDTKDLGFLAVAIPYANIVVTERFWAHLANSTGLAERYGTTVVADVARLPALLAARDCT